MQMFADHSFFAWLIVMTIPAFILGVFEKPIKYYGMFASLVFLWLALGHNTVALTYLIVFCLLEYTIIQIYLQLRLGGNRSKVLYWLFLLLSIAPLATYKVLALVGNPWHIFGFLGISYMTFKVAQMIIEIYDGIIKKVSPFEYAYLLLFFPTITSGPIDRSRRFSKDLNRKIPRSEYLELAGTGLYKILLGMVYKTVIASVLYFLMKQYGMEKDMTGVLIYYYTYGFYLFFDFAGYSLMAVGTGYLFGIKVPDNFNRPFISRDINDFWNRWHITLSHWLRDYVFSRVTMSLMRTGLRKRRLTIASIAFMTNMLLMGFWHGLTSYYILYGLYHGVLLTLFEIIRTRSGLYRKYSKEKWFIIIEWALTLHLVLFGFFIFSGRLNALMHWKAW